MMAGIRRALVSGLRGYRGMGVLGMWGAGLRVAVAAFGLCGFLGLAAAPVAAADDAHLGVGTCAGSTCHGSATPWKNSNVLQTEYFTWRNSDRHAQAYKALLSERGQRIAANLNIGKAHEAKICLDCHADNIPAAQRSRVFNLADGVGCESCHGGSQRWLGEHVSGTASRVELRALGLNPLENPVFRGQLCLNCHVGSADRSVNHRIMGAGHPRLRFELETFTAAQPPHFVVDDDYRQRKQPASPARTWAVGQVLAAQRLLAAMGDPRQNVPGLFPELAFFDCHACHHPTTEIRFEPRAGEPVHPGQPRLLDANLVMARVAAEALVPQLGSTLASQITAMHVAAAQGREPLGGAVRAVQATLAQVLEQANREPGREQIRRMTSGLIELAGQSGYRSFAIAEQTAMALGSLLAHQRAQGQIAGAQYDAAAQALERVYQTVEREQIYDIRKYVAALAGYRQALAMP